MDADGRSSAPKPVIDVPDDDFALLYRTASRSVGSAPSLGTVPAHAGGAVDSRRGSNDHLERLAGHLLSHGGSDLHLTCGHPPSARIDGRLVPIAGETALDAASINDMIRSGIDDEMWTRFLDRRQLDYSLTLADGSRFRVNAFHQRGGPAAALRAISSRVPTVAELGLPAGVRRMTEVPYGLVLFVGPTGSGKSTSQAALIRHLADTQACHILTIEDPVEYLHSHGAAVVNQREVGSDVRTFADGLRAALREDPDVILLGEMRDEESISITLTLAETGHLVFATLHTNDASQAIDLIVDSYPAERRNQVQTQLSAVLQGIVSQRLVRRPDGGRVAAFEVLLANDAIRNLIREGKTRQIRNVIATSSAEGMQTLEASLNRLIAERAISYDEALAICQYPKELVDPSLPRPR